MTRMEIAERVRRNAEKYREKVPGVNFDNSLREMCAICSWALCQAFCQCGYNAWVEYGHFDGHNHCWVRLKIVGYCETVEEIWDITLTQFDDDFPKVHLTTPDDELYNPLCHAEPLRDKIWWSRWPEHQRPTPHSTTYLIRGIEQWDQEREVRNVKLMPKYSETVLQILGSEWMQARDVRDAFNTPRSWLFRWSAPVFFNMMNGLVDEGIIVQEDREVLIGGEKIKQRWYRKAPA